MHFFKYNLPYTARRGGMPLQLKERAAINQNLVHSLKAKLWSYELSICSQMHLHFCCGYLQGGERKQLTQHTSGRASSSQLPPKGRREGFCALSQLCSDFAHLNHISNQEKICNISAGVNSRKSSALRRCF